MREGEKKTPIYYQLKQALKEGRIPEGPIATAVMEVILEEIIPLIPKEDLKKCFPSIPLVQIGMEIIDDDHRISDAEGIRQSLIKRPTKVTIIDGQEKTVVQRPEKVVQLTEGATMELIRRIVSGEISFDERPPRMDEKQLPPIDIYRKILTTIVSGGEERKAIPEQRGETISYLSRREKRGSYATYDTD